MESLNRERYSKKNKIYEKSSIPPPTPLVTIRNRIDDLHDLATVAYNPYTQLQLLNIGLQILKDSGMFTEGINDSRN